MRRGDVDHTLDKWQRVKEIAGTHLCSHLGPHHDLVEWRTGNGIPERIARLNDLQFGVQPTHAVADENHVFESSIDSLGIQP